jgi:membrane protease YdiL (CAAX protease family)
MDFRKVAVALLLIVPFSYLYGLTILSFEGDIEEVMITPASIILSLLFNVFILVGFSILCIYVLYNGGMKNIFKKLYFRKHKALESILVGVTFSILFLFILGTFIYILEFIGYDTSNPLAEKIADNLTFSLLFAIPILSALSEEIFFRGFLLMHFPKKFGKCLPLIITSLLFSLAHLSYGNLLQIIVPFVLGIFLGALMLYEKNILAPLSAHFAFNFIQLAVSMIL